MNMRGKKMTSDLKQLEHELMIAQKYGLSKREIENLERLIAIEKSKMPEKKGFLERLRK